MAQMVIGIEWFCNEGVLGDGWMFAERCGAAGKTAGTGARRAFRGRSVVVSPCDTARRYGHEGNGSRWETRS